MLKVRVGAIRCGLFQINMRTGAVIFSSRGPVALKNRSADRGNGFFDLLF